MNIEDLKKELKEKKLRLKKWAQPKDNKNWSHNHCEICNIEISDLKN